MRSLCKHHNTTKGVLSGVVGGLVGTIVMTQFQNAWSKASHSAKGNGSPQPEQAQESNQQQSEDATMKAAGKIASITGRKLSHQQKARFGPAVHYSFGTLQGGAYGAALEMADVDGGLLPALTFGAALFGLADELAVPALGLSGKPTDYPLSSHLYGLASHLVYGFSTEIARRGFRALLG